MHSKTPAAIDPDTGEITLAAAEGGATGAGAPRPPGAPAKAALRLDNRTYLDKERGRFKANLYNYGDGLAEAGWAFVPYRSPFKGNARGESDHREQNEDRAIRRARSTMRKKVLTYGLDHLLTLTYRDNVTDFEQTNADLSRFMRLLKQHRPQLHYLAVPERQKRGAWHWHLAVKGRQDVDLLRILWRQVVGEGNIDVQQPKGNLNRRLALVKYLSKYLSKGFKDGLRELNGHRFRSAIGMTVEASPIPIPPEARNTVANYVLQQLNACAGSVGHVWEYDSGGSGWATSWK